MAVSIPMIKINVFLPNHNLWRIQVSCDALGKETSTDRIDQSIEIISSIGQTAFSEVRSLWG
jgi:hypothetical protein